MLQNKHLNSQIYQSRYLFSRFLALVAGIYTIYGDLTHRITVLHFQIRFLAETMEFLRLFVIFNLCIQLHATSCDQQMCLCMDGIVSCVSVNFPNFYYRPYITILYFENVRMDNMKDIMSAFPNLHYMTLKNKIYFNCIWLRDIPPSVIVVSDMCLETTPDETVPETKITKGMTMGRFSSNFLNYNLFCVII